MLTTDLVKRINQEAEDYMSSVNQLSGGEKTKRFKDVHEMFEKAKDYSDDKVQLAMQTYEMVDKHIRRLDSELGKLESELKEKQVSGATGAGDGDMSVKKKVVGRQKQRGFNPKNVIKEVEAGKKRGGDQNHQSGVQQPLMVPDAPLTAIAAGEVLDMPVDPNEPTYCTCHQVSYGEMIGCDNTECPIEWFHFGCVGLTSKPKGKWYCSKCTSDRKKK